MGLPVVIGLVALVVVVRLFAARRIAAGEGRFVWIGFLPALLATIAVLVIGVQETPRSPLLGIVIAAVGLVLLVAMVRAFASISERVSATQPGGDITAAFVDPLAKLALVWGALLVGGATIVVIALIAWGVLQAAA